ncbi:hypothetical protein BD413DRAFT_25060 [Trametes elegans]|nr:hypothetical protein BD413DRAFT_25060 [Trametes elegans]
MLLSYAVLAVAYGGLLASALPDPRGARPRGRPAEANPAAYVHPEDFYHDAPAWGWAPDGPQTVMHRPTEEDEDHLRVEYAGPSRPPFPDVPDVPGDELPEPPRRPLPPPPRPPQEPPRPPFPGDGPPSPPPGEPDASKLTIYQFLETNPKFSRLFKLVNYTEDITNVLNDTSANVTFFAVPDWALPHPPPHKHTDEEELLASIISATEDQSQNGLLDVLTAAEGLIELHDHGNDDEDKKKSFFKAILKAIFQYETLPTALPSSELVKNVTFATSFSLPDGSLDGQPHRLRVLAGPGFFAPHLAVNIVSKVIRPDIQTQNGLIHVVSKPVLPPPSIFQIGFLFPEAFSTLTSALQRTGLTDAVEWREVPSDDGKHTVDGSPAVTFFAPSNKAFAKLPRNLRFFLFSPFGEKALKKLLQFHIVPELILHADYVHNASESDAGVSRRSWEDDLVDFYGNLMHNDEPLDVESYAARYAAAEAETVNAGPIKNPAWEHLHTPSPGHKSHNWDEPSRQDPPSFHGPWHAPPPPPPFGHARPLPPPYLWSDYEGPHHYHPPPPAESPFYGPHLPPPHHPGYPEHGPEHFPPPPPPSPYHRPFEDGPYGPHYPPPPPSPYNPPYGHGPYGPVPPPPSHSPPHHHLPPPPPPPHHWPYGKEPHFPPPPHHHHYPYDEAPHFPPPPHHPPFEHGPEHGPHFPPPPPPPPHHPPFEHGPHFPHPPPPPPPHFPPPGEHGGLPHKFPRPHVVYTRNTTTATLLANHTLNVFVAQLEHRVPVPGHHHSFFQTITFAQGARVALSDVPTRNGVLHVIDRVLNPRWTPKPPPHHDHHDHHAHARQEESFARDGDEEDEWAGWEQWLPRWANEE